MFFLNLMLAAFLAFAHPTHTTTCSNGTTVTTNDADGPGEGPGGGTGSGTGTGGDTGNTPPPKSE